MTKNFLLPTAVSARVAAAAIALAESMPKTSKTKNLADLSGRSNEDLARHGLLTLIVD